MARLSTKVRFAPPLFAQMLTIKQGEVRGSLEAYNPGQILTSKAVKFGTFSGLLHSTVEVACPGLVRPPAPAQGQRRMLHKVLKPFF